MRAHYQVYNSMIHIKHLANHKTRCNNKSHVSSMGVDRIASHHIALHYWIYNCIASLDWLVYSVCMSCIVDVIQESKWMFQTAHFSKKNFSYRQEFAKLRQSVNLMRIAVCLPVCLSIYLFWDANKLISVCVAVANGMLSIASLKFYHLNWLFSLSFIRGRDDIPQATSHKP